MPETAKTYIIEDEQIRRQAFGQVLLDTSLLASQELGHGCQAAWRPRRRRKEAKGERGKKRKRKAAGAGGTRLSIIGAEILPEIPAIDVEQKEIPGVFFWLLRERI